jgi:DNA-directed RNA polymerase II subunit RPB1
MPTGTDVVPLPVNFQRLITNAKTIFRLSDHQMSDLHPDQIVTSVKDLCDKLHVIKGEDPISVDVKNSATQLWKSVRDLENNCFRHVPAQL